MPTLSPFLLFAFGPRVYRQAENPGVVPLLGAFPLSDPVRRDDDRWIPNFLTFFILLSLFSSLLVRDELPFLVSVFFSRPRFFLRAFAKFPLFSLRKDDNAVPPPPPPPSLVWHEFCGFPARGVQLSWYMTAVAAPFFTAEVFFLHARPFGHKCHTLASTSD